MITATSAVTCDGYGQGPGDALHTGPFRIRVVQTGCQRQPWRDMGKIRAEGRPDEVNLRCSSEKGLGEIPSRAVAAGRDLGWLYLGETADGQTARVRPLAYTMGPRMHGPLLLDLCP
jgi:hypothetical protein